MVSRTAIGGILRADALRLVRDQFLLGMCAYIIGVAVMLRFAMPWITGELAERTAFDLVPWYPLISSHFVVGLAGLMAGIIGGLLLMEGRESRTVKALLVTPVPLASYLLVICSVLFIAAIGFAVLQGLIIGIALPPWPALLLTSVAAAPTAVAIALSIGAFASNKTEAFVYMKICGVLPLVPSAAYFLPEPWQWLAGVHPSYFAAKAYWIAEAGDAGWVGWAVGGMVPAAAWLWLTGRAYMAAARV